MPGWRKEPKTFYPKLICQQINYFVARSFIGSIVILPAIAVILDIPTKPISNPDIDTSIMPSHPSN